jgi:hypothetical protein
MRLVQLVYVSSFIDEYGIRLPELMERFVEKHPATNLRLMTLFAHGDVMQLLEGGSSTVTRALRALPIDAMQFAVTPLLSEPINEPCLQANCIGLAGNSLQLITPKNSQFDLFRLHPIGVGERLAKCVASKLMVGFAETHQ